MSRDLNWKAVLDASVCTTTVDWMQSLTLKEPTSHKDSKHGKLLALQQECRLNATAAATAEKQSTQSAVDADDEFTKGFKLGLSLFPSR